MCGDIEIASIAAIDRDITVTAPDRAGVTCSYDPRTGTFCCEGEGVRGVVPLILRIDDDTGPPRDYAYELATDLYLDGSRWLKVEISTLTESVITQDTGGNGVDPGKPAVVEPPK